MSDVMLPDPARETADESRGRSGRALAIGLLIAALLTVAGVVVFRQAAGVDPIAARVPASADVFVQLTLQPSISQQRLVRDLADALPGGRAQVQDTIDVLLERFTATFPLPVGGRWVETWVGDQVAFVLWRAPGSEIVALVFVAHARDVVAAQAAVDRINATNDGVAVLERGFVTVTLFSDDLLARFRDAAASSPLVRDRAFRTGRTRVGGDNLLLARLDLAALRGPLAQLPLLSGLHGDEAPRGRVIVGGRAIAGGLEFSAVEESALLDDPLPEPGPLPLLEEFAEDAHAAAATTDAAALLRVLAGALPQAFEDLQGRTGLDLGQDLLSWLAGPAAFRIVNFGDDEHHLSLVAEASDAEAMRSFVQTLRGVIAFASPGGMRVIGDDEDRFAITYRDFRAEVLIDGDRLEVEIASKGASTAITDAGALRAVPEGDVSFAGGVTVDLLREETDLDQLFRRDGPLGAFGAAIGTVRISGTRDSVGPIFSVALLLEEHP